MADVNSMLNQRIKKSPHTSKMAAMAKQSATGNLTSFSGVFSISELNEREKKSLESLLKTYAQEDSDIQSDLPLLLSLTAEVKAINNQAVILHGERIKKAHQLLTRYRDGAFTTWLVATYGNRQTPYNLMQYYDFCEAMPKALRPQIEWMPRQAVYVLASRSGGLEKKREIVEKYRGESKAEVLTLIRQTFPLEQHDKRQQKREGEPLIQGLQRLYQHLQRCPHMLSPAQKAEVRELLLQVQQLLE